MSWYHTRAEPMHSKSFIQTFPSFLPGLRFFITAKEDRILVFLKGQGENC